MNPCGRGLRLVRPVMALALLAVLTLALHGPGHAQSGDPPADPTPDNEMAQRWWNTLSPEQMVAALFGDSATAEQATAARNPYAGLDMATKGLVNDAASEIYGNGGFQSVGAWWESLDCRLMRVAAGDGNTADPESPYCAHYPGSGQDRLLATEQKDHVDTVGMALLDLSEPGVYPPDITPARLWWNTLNADQMVAALHGDGATPEQRDAAQRMYAELDPETKKLVHDAAASIYGTGRFSSVGAWWESLDCRLMRVATGDGNTADSSSPYCAHYPGSGLSPLLGTAEKNHVDKVGMALLDRSDPGVFPPDSDRAKAWWNALNGDQMAAALFGDAPTTDQNAAARNPYADLDPETKKLVHDATASIYGAGGFDSVGAWWESLNCPLMRVAAGDGNTADSSSPYCAHYPGSGLSPLLGTAEKNHVDKVGMALLGRSDPGVFPPVDERLGQAARVLLPVVTRAILSSAVDTVGDRAYARLAGPAADAPGLSLAGSANLPEALALHGKAMNDGAADLTRLLARSSFVLPLNGSGDPDGFKLWGSGDYRNLSGAANRIDWEGNVVSAHVGTDVMLRRNLLAGLAVSFSQGALDYTDRIGGDARAGEYETDLISLNPYAGWVLRSGIRIWAMAGHGWGRVRLNHEDSDEEHSSDMTQWSGALGVRGNLYSSGDGATGGGTVLDLKGEGSLGRGEIHGSANMEELTTTVSRLRLALEGTHTRLIGTGNVLTPSLALGVLADGGSGQTGAGLEVGGGVKLTQTSLGLTVEARGRTLLAHGEDVEEWSAGGALHVDPGLTGQGWSVSVAPSWGVTPKGPGDLWQRGLVDGTGDHSMDTAMRLAGELGYGLHAYDGRGLVTPYAGFLLSGHGTREYRAGARVRVKPSLAVALQGTQRRQTNASVEHGVTVQASIRW